MPRIDKTRDLTRSNGGPRVERVRGSARVARCAALATLALLAAACLGCRSETDKQVAAFKEAALLGFPGATLTKQQVLERLQTATKERESWPVELRGVTEKILAAQRLRLAVNALPAPGRGGSSVADRMATVETLFAKGNADIEAGTTYVTEVFAFYKATPKVKVKVELPSKDVSSVMMRRMLEKTME